MSIPTFVLAGALCACSAEPELLNSERIQQQFGSYGIEVLHQDDQLRRSNLFSTEGSAHICRTYAVVQIERPVAEELAGVHAAVVAGQSIGATLHAAGWHVRKETLYVDSLRLPDAQHPLARLMHLDAATDLGLHVYRLHADKNRLSLPYATIIEVHHPAHLTEQDLLRLYADATRHEFDAAQLARFTELVLN